MKKTIFFLFAFVALATGACGAQETKAQNDTTAIAYRTIKWESETFVSKKTGKSRTEYSVTLDGVTYPTNKTSEKRYATIKRFGGEPCLALINKKRVVTL